MTQCLISQNLNVANHTAVDVTGEMVSINSKSYYLFSSEDGCCHSNMNVNCVNDSGRMIFKQPLDIYPINNFGRLIKTNDKALFVNGHSTQSCDTGPSVDFIAKVDTNGTVLFKTLLPSSSMGYYPIIRGITQHPDSSYYLVSSTDLYHYSKFGQFISVMNSGVGNMCSILALVNGNLLISGTIASANVNVIMSPAGVILSQQTCLNYITKFIETPNCILAKTINGILEKYNSTLIVQTSSTIGLNPATYQINDFAFRNDSIFVSGDFGSFQNPFYAILGSGLTLFSQSQANYKGINPTGITLNNKNHIQIVTTSSSKTSALYSFIGLYRFDIGGTFHSTSDIGVTGFSNLNTALLGNGNGGGFMTPYIEMTAIVKNYGIDTVKNFYLNYYSYLNGGSSNCYILLHKFLHVTIAPGAAISVTTGSFYAEPFYPSTPITSTKLNLCLFTTVPNSSNDIEINNDAFCDSVLFTVTGIEENKLMDESINVFPNPFNSSFHLTSTNEIKEIKLVDALGILLKDQIIESKETDVSSEDLSRGVYFLKIETEKGFSLKKIIKN